VVQVLVVHLTSGAPTGQVFNPDRNGFVVHDASGNSGSALFIFASETARSTPGTPASAPPAAGRRR